MAGIAMATIIGHLFIWYGRVKFVYSGFLNIGIKKYWIKQVQMIGMLWLQLLLTRLIVRESWNGIKGCLYRELSVLLSSVLCILLICGIDCMKKICSNAQKN